MTQIHTNEFPTIAIATQAQAFFPFCGTCKGMVKLQTWRGAVLLLCMTNPHHHDISSVRKDKNSALTF